MLKLKKIKPVGCKVLVTENLYGYDDFNEAGLIIHKKGDLKPYQQVVAVGDDVKFIKPGDFVIINYYKYCSFENDEQSVKVNGTNTVVDIHLDEVEIYNEKDEAVTCFLIDWRDIKYTFQEDDFDEVVYDKKDNLITVPKAPSLILPSSRIKV